MDKVHGVVTAENLKVFTSVPFNVVANQQVHKLVQVICLCTSCVFSNLYWWLYVPFQVLGESLHIAMEYFTQEAKVASLTSRMETLEEENSSQKRKLIEFMHEVNTLKESTKTLTDDLQNERQLTLEKDEQLLEAKEKLKTIAARSVEAFQQTEEYNIVLFSWYFKGFELLRWYLIKHPTGVDLQNLDLEVVDQEMAIDEAAQSSAPEDDAPEKAPADDAVAGDDVAIGDDAAVCPRT